MADIKGVVKKLGEIEQRQTYVVTMALADGVNIKETQIDIDFEPDIMIVRAIHYYNGGADEPSIALIRSNIVRESQGIIGSFANSATPATPNLVFRMEKPIRGRFTFQTIGIDGDLTAGYGGDLAIFLEFIKAPGKKSDLP